MRILNRYFWQETGGSILMIMLGLLAMFSFFDLIQEIETLGKGTYGISNMLVFVLLSVPGHIYEVMPIAVLVGTMFTLGNLGRHSELTVMRVSGMSMQDIGLSLLKIGAIFMLITFLVGELIAPFSEKMAHRLRIKATDNVTAQEFQSGLWIKDERNFINAEALLPDASLLKLKIYEFDENAKLSRIRMAQKASFQDKNWQLEQVTDTVFLPKETVQNQTVSANFTANATWQTAIKPELLNVLLVLPEKMSAWNLYKFINHLERNKQKTTRYDVALWAKLIYPMACLVMIMLALPFGFLQQRAGGVSAKIFIGLLLGVTYHILNRVFVHLGVLNDWPPLLSAIVPTLLFLALALALIWQFEKR